MPHQHLIQASNWVGRHIGLVPAGRVLDLACGRGRHSLLALALGHPVLAIDRDAAALAELTESAAQLGLSHQLETLCLDLEGATPPDLGTARFAGVIVTNYLHRPLMASICASVAADGVLIYETFSAGNARFGKPSNPDFLLWRGELLSYARDLIADGHVVAFEEGEVREPQAAVIQRIVVVRTMVEAAFAQADSGRAGA